MRVVVILDGAIGRHRASVVYAGLQRVTAELDAARRLVVDLEDDPD